MSKIDTSQDSNLKAAEVVMVRDMLCFPVYPVLGFTIVLLFCCVSCGFVVLGFPVFYVLFRVVLTMCTLFCSIVLCLPVCPCSSVPALSNLVFSVVFSTCVLLVPQPIPVLICQLFICVLLVLVYKYAPVLRLLLYFPVPSMISVLLVLVYFLVSLSSCLCS